MTRQVISAINIPLRLSFAIVLVLYSELLYQTLGPTRQMDNVCVKCPER